MLCCVQKKPKKPLITERSRSELPPVMDSSDTKHEILSFCLPGGPSVEKTFTRVLIQLFGYAGHGKSAFVNSCIYTLGTEGFKIHAKTGSDGRIITTKRNSYRLTDTISIVDNRGFGRKDGAEEAVVYSQLGHFHPLDEEVVLTKDFVQIMSLVEDSDLNPNYTDFIVPMFIYSVKHLMPDEQVKEVETFFKNCIKMTGVSPIVVLTHKSKRGYRDLEEKFRRAGAELVVALENYTPEDHMKTRGRCADIQKVIVNALKDVKFRLGQPRDPMRERVERKKFLLKFAHEFTVKEKEDKIAKKVKEEEYKRLEALANESWTYKFPYGK